MTVLTWLKQRSKTRCCQRVSYLLVTNTWNVSLYHLILNTNLHIASSCKLRDQYKHRVMGHGSYCLNSLWCTKNLILTASSLSFVITTFLSLCVNTVALLSIKCALCDKAKTLLPRIKPWWKHRWWVRWEILCTRLRITSKVLGMLNKIMLHCVLYKNWGCVCRSAQVICSISFTGELKI